MFTPQKIHVDIETYSSVDLKKCGVHKYAASLDFEIMLVTIGYYRNDQRVYETYEPTNDLPIPESRVKWLTDATVQKYAFNAMFERVCFGAWLGKPLDPAQWRCVMVKCGFAGLPMSLDKVSKVLDLENVKLAGSHLINYYAKPCKPSRANGGRRRNLPHHDAARWAAYKEYNIADVASEWDIDEYLDNGGVLVPQTEWDYYALDQQINDRGVQIDAVMARNGVDMAAKIKDDLIREIEKITGLNNGRSVSQLMRWFADNNIDMPNLQSETLRDALSMMSHDYRREVISLREQASRTSTDKYAAAVECIESDGRARGLFAFNGASRTGRFAGRRVQMQNLSRIHFTEDDNVLDFARQQVVCGDVDTFEMLYDAPIEILSQLIRTVFIAAPGNVLVAADYSAIEARVLAWLAGEEWKLDVFRTHGKIYEATAARMFNVPFESVTKGSDLRQKGKVGELAFGYGGSVGAVDKMGFLKDGTLTVSEVKSMVKKWRKENPMIVKAWYNYEGAAINALRYPGNQFEANRCIFTSINDWLFVSLPSGRRLAYYGPRIKPNQWDEPSVWYEGENDKSQWTLLSTYGGKLTENITQAIARDVLCHAQKQLADNGYDIVLHVHDEIGCEVNEAYAEQSLKAICDIMAIVPEWAVGLPLRADGFVSKYYKK